MGHFIRKNAPTLVEQQHRVELDGLHSKVTDLVRKVDSIIARNHIKKTDGFPWDKWICQFCKGELVHGRFAVCPRSLPPDDEDFACAKGRC
jgi:hypothetical protein